MKKKFKNRLRKEVQKKFELDIIYDLKAGLRPSQIAKKNNISKTKLQYYLGKLKDKGLIKKIGYGVWETKEVQKEVKHTSSKTVKEVRGHAFIWTIKIPKLKNWNRRKEILEINNIKPTLVGSSKIPMITVQNRRVLLGTKTIIIYELSSFLAETSLESRKLAVNQLFEYIGYIESKLGVSLKINGNYEFKVSREHYGLIKNNLAVQCNKEREKIYVKDKDGLWFIIDNSYNVDEAETIGKNAMLNNLGVQEYFNSHKRHNFKVTPDFVLTTMDGIQQNQLIFAENMKSHIEAIQTLSKEVKRLSKVFKDTIKENQKLKRGSQTTLNSYFS